VTCTKIPHPTRDAALAHIKALVWKNHLAGEPARSAGLAAYPCDGCGAWHVGHAQRAPLVYHYTVMATLEAILASDALRPAPPRRVGRRTLRQLSQVDRIALRQLDEPEPLLWFSWNAAWDASVNIGHPPSRARTEILGQGLLRFGAPASVATLRWSDYLARNRTARWVRDIRAQYGHPAEWLATPAPVPLAVVRAIEVYVAGAWVPVADVDPDAFEAYLAARPAAYVAARSTLAAKLAAAHTAACDTLDLTEPERVLLDDCEHAIRLDGPPAAAASR
jgi:hypothetical protein